MRAEGYNYNTYMGENIAAGYPTAAAVFEGWKNSRATTPTCSEPTSK